MKTNIAAKNPIRTYEGAQAGHETPSVSLRRAVSTCLLFEDTFYEKGSDIASRIVDLCAKVSGEELSALAIEARSEMRLRHVPLFLAKQLVKLHPGSKLGGDTLASVIQRPDEMTEFLSLYWTEGRCPIAAQVKAGLSRAFRKFSEYQLAKWNRDSQVKLKDVLFLCHAKPENEEQAALWKRLIDGTLAAPDTWEVALSSGADKKATWERLLTDRKLGYSALLQNLRNMESSGVSRNLIEDALRSGAAHSKLLPFRFLAAYKAAPSLAPALSDAMVLALQDSPKLPGTNYVVVDVSGSMDVPLSSKSQLSRLDTASGLAVLVREKVEQLRCFTFSNDLMECPAWRGLAMVEGISNSQLHAGTALRAALTHIKDKFPAPDRLIVITDEQSQDGIASAWVSKSYLVNVAPYKPGLDISQGWTRISGWSDRILEWIALEEGVAG